jgi:iron(III) transport system substrate-binding protein
MKLHSFIIAIIITSIAQTSLAAEEVNVYSYRKPTLIEPMLNVFTEDTGIKVNVVHAKKGMLERLKSEGLNTPADLVFTVDIGRLSDIKRAGLTQPVDSEVLRSSIPESQRDADNHWFGLTQRARFIVASKDRVKEGEVLTYEDLASDNMQGRVCTRSGKHPYMIGLTAAMIAHHGVEGAEEWVAGLKTSLARKPQGNDRAQVKAIKEGECDVAVINHYYMYKMLDDPKQAAAAESVYVIFPNQDDRGTHMNISGMAMTKHTHNTANALKLMEFLASSKAQKMYSDVNGEYAVQEDIEVPANSHLSEWGEFKRDNIALTEVAANRTEAIKIMDRVGYDD